MKKVELWSTQEVNKYVKGAYEVTQRYYQYSDGTFIYVTRLIDTDANCVLKENVCDRHELAYKVFHRYINKADKLYDMYYGDAAIYFA